MGIFLKNSHNIPPVRWGSPNDVQYAVRENCEKIYNIDYSNCLLAIPMWNDIIARDYGPYNNWGSLGSTSFAYGGIYFDGSSHLTLQQPVPHGLGVLIATKVRLDTAGAAGLLDSEGSDDYFATDFRMDAAGVLCCQYGDGGSGTTSANRRSKTGVTSLSVGKTYNLISTIRGTVYQSFFIDGIDDGGSYSGTGDSSAAGSNAGYIGRSHIDTSDYYLNGIMWHMAVFHIAANANNYVEPFNERPYALYQKVIKPTYLFLTALSTADVSATLPIITAEVHGGSLVDATLPMVTAELISVDNDLVATLPMVTAEVLGGALVDATLPIITAALDGAQEELSADIAATLPALESYIHGDGNPSFIEAELPSLTASMTGSPCWAIEAELPSLTASMTGASGGIVEAELPSLTTAMQSGHILNAALPSISSSMEGDVQIGGNISTVLPGLTAAITGKVQAIGDISATLPTLTSSLTATVGLGCDIDTTLPAITADLTGYQDISGDINVMLPALNAYLVGKTDRFGTCVPLRYSEPLA